MIRIDARAKINLSLDILGKRQDNYHDVMMIMQSVELSDVLTFREQEKEAGIQVISNIPGLPSAERNLAYKAAALVMETFKLDKGLYIDLTKRIPIAAGLAGGSTDAAAVLVALNEMWNLGLKAPDLCALGEQIGSDVPFCIQGGTMLAKGRGEILEKLSTMPECFVILAKPQASVSTAWAYQNFKADNVEEWPDTDAVIAALKNGDLEGICKHLCNVLESVTIPAHNEIAHLKRLMCKHGALASLMSGSGPTVFGLVDDEEKAEYIVEKLSDIDNVQVILTKTVSEN